MKKLLILVAIISFVSCRTAKETQSSSKVSNTTEKSTISKDSSNVTKISEAIKDDVVLSLKTNNKELDSILRQRLKGFETSKQSGKNSYSASFDYEKLALIVSGIVGESKDTSVATNNDLKQEKSFTEQTDEYFSKKIRAIPFWFWVLVGLYFLPKIIAGVTAILNPVQTLISRVSSVGKSNNKAN